jgi:hypothetical protein
MNSNTTNHPLFNIHYVTGSGTKRWCAVRAENEHKAVERFEANLNAGDYARVEDCYYSPDQSGDEDCGSL